MTGKDRIVCSTDIGRCCPNCLRAVGECVCRNETPGKVGDGIVRVSRETQGRKGKAVTVISGLGLATAQLEEMCIRDRRIAHVACEKPCAAGTAMPRLATVRKIQPCIQRGLENGLPGLHTHDFAVRCNANLECIAHRPYDTPPRAAAPGLDSGILRRHARGLHENAWSRQ